MSGILGIVAAFAVVILGSMSDGDPLSALYSATASIIVFGGTAAALLLQFGFGPMLKGIARISWVIKPPKIDVASFIDSLANWSNIARSQGSLALEARLAEIDDPFIKKGLQMIIDNMSIDDLRPTLQAAADQAGRDDALAGEVYEAAGGYSPTIGVMGAVLGLIHVMMRLDHPEELGAGIATAFVATIYGVGAANLLFLPLGTRLLALAEARERDRHVLIQGFVLLAAGKPGILIRQQLQSFITGPAKKPEAAADEAAAGGLAGEAA